MKFWQRIFISVLVLFMVSFNICMLVMMQLFSESTKITQEEAAINGVYIAESALYNQFIGFYRYNTLQKDNKKNCFLYCSSTYQYKKIYLQYYENDVIMFSSFPDENLTFDWSNGEKITNYLTGDAQMLHFSNNGVNYIAVRVWMDYPFQSSSVVYIISLQKYEEREKNLFRGFLVIEAVFAALTCILLYFVIKKVMKPLPQLSDAVTKIASGKYDEKLPTKGKDEIAILSGKINDLSDKISESIYELQETSEEKQNFIDDLGHEIRTPLTTISGYAEYLNMAVVTEEEKKSSLDYIISESHRLEHLSATLLQLASIRKSKIDKSYVDAKKVVNYIEKIFIPRCNNIGVILKTNCETDTIYTDENLIYILISNLIENAIRASSRNKEILLKIHNLREMGYKKTVITVEDYGIGMKEEDIARIEEPFYRVDKARSRESGGVGLGVSLCKQIVDIHDGTMKYDSRAGRGTTVTIVLPEADNVFELI